MSNGLGFSSAVYLMDRGALVGVIENELATHGEFDIYLNTPGHICHIHKIHIASGNYELFFETKDHIYDQEISEKEFKWDGKKTLPVDSLKYIKELFSVKNQIGDAIEFDERGFYFIEYDTALDLCKKRKLVTLIHEMANADKVFGFKFENKIFLAKKDESGIFFQIVSDTPNVCWITRYDSWEKMKPQVNFIQTSELYTASLIYLHFEKDLSIDQCSAKDLLPKEK